MRGAGINHVPLLQKSGWTVSFAGQKRKCLQTGVEAHTTKDSMSRFLSLPQWMRETLQPIPSHLATRRVWISINGDGRQTCTVLSQ